MASRELEELKKKTLEEADKFLGYDHVGEAVKECIENLITIIKSLQLELADAESGTGDISLMKRRYEQLKKDHREIERKFEKFNEKNVPLIAVELKSILTAAVAIGSAAQPIKESAQKIAGQIKPSWLHHLIPPY